MTKNKYPALRIAQRRIRAEKTTRRINIVFAFLLWIPSVRAQEPNLEALQGLGKTHYHRVDSRLLEQTYHVFVRLPEEYEPGKKFPAVYLLDGGMTFPILAGYYRYLRLGEEIPAAIIVGISYGTDDWQKGNMRSRDYTAKAADRSYWGGADNFQNILREEILSLVEESYSADPNRRIIFGQSLGGQFVLYTALTAPELFLGYIASNPALHRNLDLFLNMKPADANASEPRRLFVSSGSEDDPEFREPALKWMQHWSKSGQLPWSLKAMTLEGQSHFSAAPEAFRQGMRWVFAKVREGYLQGAENVRLYYRVAGFVPDTIVAVHGGPGAGMNAFLPHLEPLAQNHTVIFYDQRGGGRSELPADTSRLDARFFVEDLEAVRRHFGLSRMKIVAHSFGAILVARYIQSYPKRVERLVFMGATGPKRSEAAKLAQQRPAAMDSAAFNRYLELIQSLLAGTTANPIEACREYEKILADLAIKRGEPVNWRGTTCEASPEAVAYYYHYTARITPATFGDWDFTKAFSDITAPLLVVYGAQDSFALPQQHAWAQAFPNGRILLVPKAGKGAIADRPDLVFPALELFFKGRWPESAR